MSREETANAERFIAEEQTRTREKPSEEFYGTVVRSLARAGVKVAPTKSGLLAKTLRSFPRIAPAWRLLDETFNQMTRDKAYQGTVNDLWDLANIALLPYVDAMTLDKSKVDLVRRSTDALSKFDTSIDYSKRAFAKVGDLLRAIA